MQGSLFLQRKARFQAGHGFMEKPLRLIWRVSTASGLVHYHWLIFAEAQLMCLVIHGNEFDADLCRKIFRGIPNAVDSRDGLVRADSRGPIGRHLVYRLLAEDIRKRVKVLHRGPIAVMGMVLRLRPLGRYPAESRCRPDDP